MFGKSLITSITLASLVAAAPVAEIEKKELDARITHTGQATYFEVGLGACGWWNGNNDPIVALNSAQYEANHGSNCGQWMTITNTENGKSVQAYVADECPTCDYGSLDLSPSLFSALNGGNMDEGVFPISWNFHKK